MVNKTISNKFQNWIEHFTIFIKNLRMFVQLFYLFEAIGMGSGKMKWKRIIMRCVMVPFLEIKEIQMKGSFTTEIIDWTVARTTRNGSQMKIDIITIRKPACTEQIVPIRHCFWTIVKFLNFNSLIYFRNGNFHR